MVTAFSARMVSLANNSNVGCTPIVGGKKRKSNAIITNINSSTASRHTSPAASTQSSINSTMMIDYYANTHPHLGTALTTINSSKRRRQKEELRYAATIIQTALTDAGRQPMLAGSSSVDMDPSARVMTSKEFDEMENASANGDEEETHRILSSWQKTEYEVAENKLKNEASQGTSSNDNNSDEHEYDVSSMYMYLGLIQSTRHYYNFSNDDDTPATRYNNNDDNDEQQSQDYSEGLSSWTPCGDDDYFHCFSNDDDNKSSKNIDNDNRSDGQSSCCDDVGSDYESLASSSSSSEDDGISSSDHLSVGSPPSPKKKERSGGTSTVFMDNVAFSVIG